MRATLIMIFGVAGLLFAATPASAGPSCTLGQCSSTYNDSNVGLTAYFNWCTPDMGTGDYTSGEPTCRDEGVAQKTTWVSPGQHTKSSEDWDAFRVDAGWCYRVDFKIGPITDFSYTYDRRGAPAVWVKVGDTYDAHVKAQSSSVCP
jgi:hypothetical protein